MNYSAIGLMSGSSLDGLDIICATFKEDSSGWAYKIIATSCLPFSSSWKRRLSTAVELASPDYLLLHTAFGKYSGEKVNEFLEAHGVKRKIDVIASHGHTTYHMPEKNMTHQLGDGAAIAAISNIPVVSDLRNMDIALNGQGAPIVPVGEKMLFPDYRFFLNIGGICNVSVHDKKNVTAFDVCPANRVLNMLTALKGKPYDKGGMIAKKGSVHQPLLEELNALKYYAETYPKSLPNSFGTDIVFPMLMQAALSIDDAVATYTEHIAMQIMRALIPFQQKKREKMLITGGGAFNTFLVSRMRYYLDSLGIDVHVPADDIVNFKEALIMAFLGVLRLRGEVNVLSSVTGAVRNSCGGALWSVK